MGSRFKQRNCSSSLGSMKTERVLLALQVAGIVLFPSPTVSQSLRNLPGTSRARDALASSASTSETLNSTGTLKTPVQFFSIPRSSSSNLVQTVTIAASVSIVASATLLILAFVVLWKRLSLKRRRNKDSGYTIQPELRQLRTDFTAKMKPPPAPLRPRVVYLDNMSKKSLRSSIIARDPVSPLAAIQQPGFMPRPIPANIPMSVSRSEVTSMQFDHHTYPLGVSPEDLAVILDELSRHYDWTDYTAEQGHMDFTFGGRAFPSSLVPSSLGIAGVAISVSSDD
ncbi:hypothetical protein B0H10DRAFT_2079524 [Mycena sp. CBHHK59/15]|nr:hypothetical protein B0H10DRAFT_2079524 [Mycena sp. CBHHK59/15]